MLPDPLQMLQVRNALEQCAQDTLNAAVVYGEVTLCDEHPAAEFAFHRADNPGVRFIVSIMAVEEVPA